MLSFIAGWYIIYTASRKEKKIATELSQQNITNFLPLLRTTRQWHDRKKVLYVAAFPSYVFVYLDDSATYRSVLEIEGVYNYVKFSKVPAIVKQETIDQINIALNSHDVVISSAFFEAGEQLQIQEGPLAGLHCEMIKSDGKTKILVRVNLLNRNIIVDVPAVYLTRSITTPH